MDRTAFVCPFQHFVYMGRTGSKPQRYFVQFDDHRIIRVPAVRWHDWMADGVLTHVGGRVAKPAKEGVIRIGDNGEPVFPSAPPAPYMVLNCRIIESRMVYRTKGKTLSPEQLQREIQASYGRPD